mmetsp:Transcript_9500/g.18370  ORF Transcript_9500/g.18370 Transcript_9500/m.18370 type:complete len:228 (-) Transcript_9500:4800-5483(-)
MQGKPRKVLLRQAFLKHSVQGRVMFNELLVLCRNLRIYPDLISSHQLQELICTLSTKSIASELSLSFTQLERLLLSISHKAFTQPSPLNKLWAHIELPLDVHYKTPSRQNSPLIRRRRSVSKTYIGSSPLSTDSFLSKAEKRSSSVLPSAPTEANSLQSTQALGREFPIDNFIQKFQNFKDRHNRLKTNRPPLPQKVIQYIEKVPQRFVSVQTWTKVLLRAWRAQVH